MENHSDSISRETFEQIESYLLGQMDVQDKAQFQQRIQGDPALAAEVQLQAQLVAAVQVSSFLQALPQAMPGLT